jgi:RNA polymerase sigma-70 factor (ECF subfamily)
LKNHFVIERAVSEFYQPAYRFALALTGNEREAAEITQQTFLVLCKQPGLIREPDKIKPRLFATLRETFLKSARARQSRSEIFEPEQQEPLNADPGASLAVEAGRILEALSRLEGDFRTILELFYLGDFSHKEISDVLQMPMGTVMCRLSRGKERLRRALMEVDDPQGPSRFPGRYKNSSA